MNELSDTLAKMSTCLQTQDHFMTFADTIYKNQKDVKPDNLDTYLNIEGIDLINFKKCTQSNFPTDTIKNDIK